MDNSLEEEFQTIAPRLFRFLLRLCGNAELAGDLTQESLSLGWQRRAQLRSADALQPWLFRISVNVWNDHLRRQRNDSTVALDEQSAGVISPDRGPVESTMGKELGRELWNAMKYLPPRQQQVLHLRVVELMEIHEIAQITGLTSKAVRSNLAAARKRMRSTLTEYFADETSPGTQR